MVYNKFDTKAPIFTIPKDPNKPYSIILYAPRTWEDIKDLQFFYSGLATHDCYSKGGTTHFYCFPFFFFEYCSKNFLIFFFFIYARTCC